MTLSAQLRARKVKIVEFFPHEKIYPLINLQLVPYFDSEHLDLI